MLFIVQNNINEKDFQEFKDAVIKAGHEFKDFYHIPFDDSYPEIYTDKVFVYAASAVTDKIIRDFGEKFAGVYNHTSDININDLYETSKEMMWSNRIHKCIIDDLDKINIEDEFVFIRPAIDDKLFSGEVIESSKLKDLKDKFLLADDSYKKSELFIGEVNQPEYEYRLFIVNGEVSTSSLYRVHGEVVKENGSPDEVIYFAGEFYNKTDLPISCVIDIGVTGNKIGVIEVNSINNSGFYSIDKDKLIMSLSRSCE